MVYGKLSLYDYLEFILGLDAVGWVVVGVVMLLLLVLAWWLGRESRMPRPSMGLRERVRQRPRPSHRLKEQYEIWDACARRHLRNVEELFRVAGILQNPFEHALDDTLILDAMERLSEAENRELLDRLQRQWFDLSAMERKAVESRVPEVVREETRV